MKNKLTKKYNSYVAYQIYPASFYDTNNDGIGDINGIIEKIPYLKSLGIDMIWICPIFKSPMDDNGYDVSDYFDINPMFGTIDDFSRLLDLAHKNGIKIILDLVLNHTSSEHSWFKKAISDVNCEEHGYYIFKKGSLDENGNRIPPNNWEGFFDTSVWEYVPEIDEYYFHIFSTKMPDLNYENPKLMNKMLDVARFWLDRGVDGFRLDAIAHIAKDTTYENSTLPLNSHGRVLDTTKFSNRDKLFDYLRVFQKEVFSKYDCFTIGEVGGCATPEEALKYSFYETGVINMVFNFDTCWENGAYGSLEKDDSEIKTNVKNLKHLFLKWYKGCYQNADMPIYWNNHDHPRCLSQYGNINYRKESAKMLATTLLFMYGLPFILYGDEIGMSNVDYTSLSDFKDVNDINALLANPNYDKEKYLRFFKRCSRTNGRIPFIWQNKAYGGFSNVEPYIKNVNYYAECNEEDENKDEDSILNYYRKAIKIRHQEKILNYIFNQEFKLIEEDNDKVFSYIHDGETRLQVISNFTSETIKFPKHFTTIDILLHNYSDILEEENSYTLRPYESYLLEVK